MDPTKPLLSGRVAVVVGIVATVLTAAAPMVPYPWSFVVGLVGFVAAILVGQQARPPQFLEGRPILQGAALTAALSIAGVFSQLYQLIPAGWPQSLALGGMALLGLLTGKSQSMLGATGGALPKPFVDASGTPVLNSKAAADVFNSRGG